MYRASLYLSRFLRYVSTMLYALHDTAEGQQALALQKAKFQRANAAAARIDAARVAAESAKARLIVETDRFKAETMAIKDMF